MRRLRFPRVCLRNRCKRPHRAAMRRRRCAFGRGIWHGNSRFSRRTPSERLQTVRLTIRLFRRVLTPARVSVGRCYTSEFVSERRTSEAGPRSTRMLDPEASILRTNIANSLPPGLRADEDREARLERITTNAAAVQFLTGTPITG